MSVRQMLALTVNEPPSTGATASEFFGYHTNQFAWTQFEFGVFNVPGAWSVAGTFTTFAVLLQHTPAAGRTYTLAIRKNGVDTGLAISIPSGSFGGSVSASIAVAPGDRIGLHNTITGGLASGTGTGMVCILEFMSTNPGESGHMTAIQQISDWNASPTWYAGIGDGGGNNFTALPNLTGSNSPYQIQELFVIPGAITRYDVFGAGGGASAIGPGVGKSITFALYKNGVKQDGTGGTVDTRFTLSGATTSGFWTGTLPVVVGDTVYVELTPTGFTAGQQTPWGFGYGFAATTDGDFQLGSHGQPPIGLTRWITGGPNNLVLGYSNTESLRQNLTATDPFYINGLTLSADPAQALIGQVNILTRLNLATPPTPAFLNNASVYGGSSYTSLWIACNSGSGLLQIPGGATWDIQVGPAFTPPVIIVTGRSVPDFRSGNYPHLDQIQDPQAKLAVKLLYDRVGALEATANQSPTLSTPTDTVAGNQQRVTNLADPQHPTDAVNLRTLHVQLHAAFLSALQSLGLVQVP